MPYPSAMLRSSSRRPDVVKPVESSRSPGDNRLKQCGQRLRGGDVRRMAGVDLVISPARLAFGALREAAKWIRGRDARAIDIAARHRDLAAGQAQRHLEAL